MKLRTFMCLMLSSCSIPSMIWFISKFSVEYGYIINEMGGELSVGLEHPDECASGVDNI